MASREDLPVAPGDEQLVAEVQDKVLALAHGPGSETDDAQTVQAIVDQHGEDAILEFVRVTVRGVRGHREAGKRLFGGDEDAGGDLGIVVSRSIYCQLDHG